jgi:hypothetical protein
MTQPAIAAASGAAVRQSLASVGAMALIDSGSPKKTGLVWPSRGGLCREEARSCPTMAQGRGNPGRAFPPP